MTNKAVIILFFLTFSCLSKGQLSCNDASTMTPSAFFYPGPSYNFMSSGAILYLCPNAVVYDTLTPVQIGDRFVMIEPGAKYVWKRCGGALSSVWIKSGGTLTLLPDWCPTAMNLFLEPGAVFIDSYNNIPVPPPSCSLIAFPLVNCATGINEKLKIKNEELIIFPQPANQNLELRINPDSYRHEELFGDFKTISIYNNLGQRIRREELFFEKNIFVLNTSSLVEGAFIPLAWKVKIQAGCADGL